jgi:DNA-binding MarR family transcriptional regulator
MLPTRKRFIRMTKKKQVADPAASAAPVTPKKGVLIGLLQRPGGATLAEITGATSWLPHTARAMLTRLRKKGLAISKEKVDGATRFRMDAEPVA